MPKLALLAILAAALQLAACGSDPLDMERGEDRGTTTEARRGTATDEPSTTQDGERDTTAAGTNAAKRRVIYLDAQTLCSEFGVQRIVRRFGVEPGSAADVARAYAERNYSAPFQEAGYRGCLAGFER